MIVVFSACDFLVFPFIVVLLMLFSVDGFVSWVSPIICISSDIVLFRVISFMLFQPFLFLLRSFVLFAASSHCSEPQPLGAATALHLCLRRRGRDFGASEHGRFDGGLEN